MQPTKFTIWLVLFLLVGLTVGCDLAGEAAEEREATVDALQEMIVLTATAVAADEVTSDELVATAEAAATKAVATISAVATEEVIAVTATAEAAEATRAAQPEPPAPTNASPFELSGEAETAVLEELPLYDVDPTQGGPALGHPATGLALAGAEASAITSEFRALVIEDFVLAADVTPNVQAGSAACGLVLRAGAEADAFQYVVLPGPPGSGQVLLQTWQGDTPLVEETIAFDASGLDPNFTEANQATNRLAVVAEGPTLTVYSNGTRLGEATPDTAVVEGIVAFLIVTETPAETEAACRFDNAWLWLLSPAGE